MLLPGGGWSRRDLFVSGIAADRAPELLEPLTNGAAGVGQSLRSEQHQSNDQNDKQVSG